MNTFSKIRVQDILLTIFSAVSLFLISATDAFGATAVYEPLVGIPGVTDQGTMSLPNYLNVIYLTVIGIGALVGVIKIGMAGVKYSLSDVVTNKESARHDIMGVLLGLAILLIPFIVLNTIYPDLTSLNVLNRTSELKVNLEPTRAKTGNGGGAGTQNVPQASSNEETCRAGGGTWEMVSTGKATIMTCKRPANTGGASGSF